MKRAICLGPLSVCAVVALVAMPLSAQEQSAEEQATEAPKSVPSAAGDGQIAFNNYCRTCHATDAGDNRLGPSLAGVVGREAGAVSGFNYSQSLKNAGLTWDEARLDAFIANPDSVVPGNNMKPYTGIDDAKVRGAIIGFLKSSQ